jgi:PKD repeat protein
MTSVHGIRVTGGSFPARIWASFMNKALEKTERSSFERPAGLVTKVICAESGSPASEFCPNRLKALLFKTASTDTCELHAQPAEVKVPRLVGLSKDAALAKLTALGLVPSVTEKPITGVASGIVAEQEPAAGTKLKAGSKVRLVVATGAAANEPPIAAFTAPTDARAGRATVLDGSESSDDGKITKYLWEFGDGATKTGKTVSHTWATAGTYDVTLWVTDDKGAQASVTHRITVR